MYAVFKLLRPALVPMTDAIPITDARDPHDLLMLIETIQVCRATKQLKKEEELFFLLIDIIRNPVVFKHICGDSTKNDEEDDVSAAGSSSNGKTHKQELQTMPSWRKRPVSKKSSHYKRGSRRTATLQMTMSSLDDSFEEKLKKD